MSREVSATTIETDTFVPTKKANVKIWVCSLKKNILSICFCLFVCSLILFSNTNFLAAKNGLILWATSVIPALFPFFVATELLSHTSIVAWLGKYLSPIMKPLFGVPGEGAFAFIMGLISGYPVGAKIVSNFKEKRICTQEEAERMLSFTNNSGPLFIVGTVGISLFGDSRIGLLLFVTHVLACISVGISLNLFSLHQRKKKKLSSNYSKYTSSFVQTKNSTFSHAKVSLSSEETVSFSSLGEILGKSIMNSISTILLIGGFVVLFSVIISILNQSHLLELASTIIAPVFSALHIPTQLINPILSGIVELTNGVKLVANIPLKEISVSITACSFLLGFGGFSVLLQVFSIISKFGLSIKKYFWGKLLQGLFAAFYTFLALQFLPWFQFNL